MKEKTLMAASVALLLAVQGDRVACEEKLDKHPVTDLKGPNLGQAPPGDEARIFAPGVVSLEGRYEYAVSFDPDGDRILFTVEVPDEGASVHCTWIQDGFWTTPRRVSLTGGARKSEMEAFFSPDGKRLFFAPYDEGMDVRIWTADVTADGWRNPRPLGPPVNEDPAFYPVMANDGTLYYTNLAKRAVYSARLDNGNVADAGAAGLERGGHAFPSPDGRFLLVDSASLATEGQRDIFVAFRNDDGTWGSPRDLGPAVNTEYSETCPSLSPDGRYLFFSRYDEPGKLSNIYWVSTEVITKAAPRED